MYLVEAGGERRGAHKRGHDGLASPAGRHAGRGMKKVTEMTWWEKLKMNMTMAMGMEHAGLAGREMAAMMEGDIRNKFWFALLLTVPIIAYSLLGEKIFGLTLPSPLAAADFVSLAGHGVKATVEGRAVLAGTEKLLRDLRRSASGRARAAGSAGGRRQDFELAGSGWRTGGDSGGGRPDQAERSAGGEHRHASG